MRTTANIMEIEDWVMDLRSSHSLPKVIEQVERRMRNAAAADQRYLALILQGLLIETGNNDEASSVLKQMIEHYPDDVRLRIAFATMHFYFIRDLQKALTSIEEAIEVAARSGFFLREVLGNKARILLELGDGEGLARTLEQIMDLKMQRDIPDIGRERDFVDRCPPGLVPDNVLARYDAFCPKEPE